MLTLNEMVDNYKKTKDKKMLETIYNQVAPAILSRAKYCFYKQNFFINGQETTLFKSKVVEFTDVLQSYNLELLYILKRYKKNNLATFFTFFISSLKKVPYDILKVIQSRSVIKIETEYIIDDSNLKLEAISGAIDSKIESDFDELDERENLIVEYLSSGLKCTEIAKKLKLSKGRISQLVSKIQEKLKSYRIRR